MGDDILVEQHKRGELQIKLNELSAETGVVTFYLIWEGTSDSSCMLFMYAQEFPFFLMAAN